MFCSCEGLVWSYIMFQIKRLDIYSQRQDPKEVLTNVGLGLMSEVKLLDFIQYSFRLSIFFLIFNQLLSVIQNCIYMLYQLCISCLRVHMQKHLLFKANVHCWQSLVYDSDGSNRTNSVFSGKARIIFRKYICEVLRRQ